MCKCKQTNRMMMSPSKNSLFQTCFLYFRKSTITTQISNMFSLPCPLHRPIIVLFIFLTQIHWSSPAYPPLTIDRFQLLLCVFRNARSEHTKTCNVSSALYQGIFPDDENIFFEEINLISFNSLFVISLFAKLPSVVFLYFIWKTTIISKFPNI